MFRTIVVPLDGSRLAEKAVPSALLLATQLKARLQLMTVVDHEQVFYEAPQVTYKWKENRLGKFYLDGVAQQVIDPSISLALPSEQVETAVMEGKPGPVIVDYARSHPDDLIVMATHGQNWVESFILGSVAHYVMHHCPTPVLFVHPTDTASNGTLAHDLAQSAVTGYRGPIVVALDGTEIAEKVLGPAIALAQQMGVGINLVGISWQLAPLLALHYLPDIEERVLRHGVPCTRTIGIGDTATHINAYAETIHASLIVLIAKPDGVLNGRVAYSVVRHAVRPVLIVPDKPYDTHTISEKHDTAGQTAV